MLIDFNKFPHRTIHRKSLHWNSFYSCQISTEFISLFTFKQNRNEHSGQNFKALDYLVHSYHFWVRRSDEVTFISVGTCAFYLHSYMVPGITRWLNVSMLTLHYQHKITYLKDSVYSVIALKSSRNQKPFCLYQLLRSVSLFSALCLLLLASDSILTRKACWDHSCQSEISLS